MSINFNNIKKELELNDGMPFGKYLGIPLARVIVDDTKYFTWMINNSDSFFCSDKVHDFYKEVFYKRMLKDMQQTPFLEFDEEDIPF